MFIKEAKLARIHALKFYDEPLKMKEKVDHQSSIGMSYFRTAKPVYYSKVYKLRYYGQVLAEEEVILEGLQLIPEGSCIKLLFYNDENNKLQLMIGIGSINSSDKEYGSSEDYLSDDVPSSAVSPQRLSIQSLGGSKRNFKKV